MGVLTLRANRLEILDDVVGGVERAVRPGGTETKARLRQPLVADGPPPGVERGGRGRTGAPHRVERLGQPFTLPLRGESEDLAGQVLEVDLGQLDLHLEV